MKCLVTSHRPKAKAVQDLLGPEWKVLCPLDPLLGYHFDLIVFSRGWDCGRTDLERSEIMNWAHNQLIPMRGGPKCLVIGE